MKQGASEPRVGQVYSWQVATTDETVVGQISYIHLQVSPTLHEGRQQTEVQYTWKNTRLGTLWGFLPSFWFVFVLN